LQGEIIMKVGFIGLGQMGSGMAANLLKAGHQVSVYNRTADKTAKLVELGAEAPSQLAAVCANDVVVTMLANDAALESVVFAESGVLKNMPGNAVHVSCSTISVDLSKRLAAAHEKEGQHFVSAPVFGRPEAAEAGKLFIVAGGPAQVIRTCMPVLESMGQKVFVMSEKPEAANLVKISGNFLIASVIEALGEAIALVGKGGVDRRQYLELLTSTLFNAPVYKTYGGLIVEGKFQPAGFSALLGQKDVHLALSAADTLSVPMPIASLLRDRFLSLIASGGEALDWSAIGQLAARDAGI
jgi:3-hydroxyisobutyrate dehydrogenase-like beta-hydroxyacid dehydrogenase